MKINIINCQNNEQGQASLVQGEAKQKQASLKRELKSSMQEPQRLRKQKALSFESYQKLIGEK